MQMQLDSHSGLRLRHNPGHLGYSHEGRALEIATAGNPRAPLRILVLAGQHGDEPLARQVVQQFARTARRIAKTGRTSLALLVNVNPDGAAHNKRKNGRGLDLNRDHQQLRSAELQALHRYVRAWRPHMIVDVHTYPARRKHLTPRGLVYCHDVFLDCPTNPSIRSAAGGADPAEAVDWIVSRLGSDGYLAGRYTMVRPSGRIRHGTPDVVDARNHFALRHDIPTLLLEGRQVSLEKESAQSVHRVCRAMTRSLQLAIDWAELRAISLMEARDLPDAGDAVPIDCSYLRTSRRFEMPFRSESDDGIRRVLVAGRFTPEVEVTQSVRLPKAYAVPRSHASVIELLGRHGFTAEAPAPGDHTVTQYEIVRCVPSRRGNRSPKQIDLGSDTSLRTLDDHLLYPVHQPGGHALAVLLEPSSKYGLARFDSMHLTLQLGARYPILRRETAD